MNICPVSIKTQNNNQVSFNAQLFHNVNWNVFNKSNQTKEALSNLERTINKLPESDIYQINYVSNLTKPLVNYLELLNTRDKDISYKISIDPNNYKTVSDALGKMGEILALGTYQSKE
ncbi:MAG: hypothetical protein MJ237_01600 [bacterium]|nr:hypothetical protein [bacterium]